MYALIINPISGNGRGRQEQPRVEALLRRESVPYRTFVAESAAEARTYARQAAEEKMTGVIAVGGDGTLFVSSHTTMASESSHATTSDHDSSGVGRCSIPAYEGVVTTRAYPVAGRGKWMVMKNSCKW